MLNDLKLLLGGAFGLLALTVLALFQCTNNPYPEGAAAKNTLFMSFLSAPDKLDPASAYFSHEGFVLGKIYEPPFGYHYLKRPYELIPLTAKEIPEPVLYDALGQRMREGDPTERVARVEYTIELRDDVLYQPHPCFARGPDGTHLYRDLTEADLEGVETPNDFPEKGTRTLTAADYVLQMRRLADPRNASPVASVMARYIVGFEELGDAIERMIAEERARRRAAIGPSYSQEEDERSRPLKIDLMQPRCPGVQLIDEHTYKIVLKREYPQILYWMAMNFFSPVPQEAIDFYSQAPLVQRNIDLNHWPVGTNAHYLEEFDRNHIMVLERNPNFRKDWYPTEGEPEDEELGLLDDAGREVPFIDRLELRLEREAIPRWNKFLQGYYDGSGISEDVFSETINLSSQGEPALSDEISKKGVRLITSTNLAVGWLQFNMLDDVVGGYDEKHAKLRQAISIAMDWEEYLQIFANGRGEPAQGLLPPGLFGYVGGREGVNPYVYEWNETFERPVSKPLSEAKRLLAEAGYPDGRNPDGRPLTIYFDHSMGGNPDFPELFGWLQRQFDKIGIRLEERGTDLAKLREKFDSGNWQLNWLGWLADYPDPENFTFLFYGPNSKAVSGGENMSNYQSPEFDRLHEIMVTMPNNDERLLVIRRMMDILRHDAPKVWITHGETYALYHDWYRNVKIHEMTYNTLKYQRIDAAERAALQKEWNKPRRWPVIVLLLALYALLIPGTIVIYRRERKGV